MSAQPDEATMEQELRKAGWVELAHGVPSWPATNKWDSPGGAVTAPNMAAAWQLLQQDTDPAPPGSSIRVTTEDMALRESKTEEVPRDGYIVVCAGRRYVAHEQVHFRSGTIQLTLKLRAPVPS